MTFAIGDKVYPGLSKITEESGEVLEVIGKLMATGGGRRHWSGRDLHVDLMDELADLQAAIDFFMGDCTREERGQFAERRVAKLNLFRKWHWEQSPEGDPP